MENGCLYRPKFNVHRCGHNLFTWMQTQNSIPTWRGANDFVIRFSRYSFEIFHIAVSPIITTYWKRLNYLVNSIIYGICFLSCCRTYCELLNTSTIVSFVSCTHPYGILQDIPDIILERNN